MDNTTPETICARSPELIAQKAPYEAVLACQTAQMPERRWTPPTRAPAGPHGGPRASVMALSQRLGLARNTVQARLTRLEQRRPGAFDRRVRPEALGYRLSAYVTVQVVQRSLAEVSDGLAHIPEVLEVTGLSGVADLLVQIVARDADDLWRITEQVLAIPGVQRIDTALAMRRFVDHRVTPLLERAAGG